MTSLRGKRVMITGATSGIGRASATALADQGAQLILLCRNKPAAESLAAEISRSGESSTPEILIADFADLSSVRSAAQTYLDSGKPLDILLNNAGLINTRRRESVDGFEETFAVNHLAPFLLTTMLLPTMPANAGSRVVNVASAAHAFCRGMQFDDLQFEKTYRTFKVYGHSKLANILFTQELSRRLEQTGITANSLHPGAVSTRLGAQNSGVLSSVLTAVLRPFFKSPQQGAATSVFLCSEPSLADCSGGYYADCRQVAPRPWAADEVAASELWRVSEDMVGFTSPV